MKGFINGWGPLAVARSRLTVRRGLGLVKTPCGVANLDKAKAPATLAACDRAAGAASGY